MGKKAKFGAEPSDRTVDSNTIHEENNRQTFVFVFFEVGQNERAYLCKTQQNRRSYDPKTVTSSGITLLYLNVRPAAREVRKCAAEIEKLYFFAVGQVSGVTDAGNDVRPRGQLLVNDRRPDGRGLARHVIA